MTKQKGTSGQFNRHQDEYDVVAVMFTVQFFNKDETSLINIRTGINEQRSHSKPHNEGA